MLLLAIVAILALWAAVTLVVVGLCWAAKRGDSDLGAVTARVKRAPGASRGNAAAVPVASAHRISV
jgi:hypothetical protein